MAENLNQNGGNPLFQAFEGFSPKRLPNNCVLTCDNNSFCDVGNAVSSREYEDAVPSSPKPEICQNNMTVKI